LAKRVLVCLLLAVLATTVALAVPSWQVLLDQYQYDQAAPLNPEVGSPTLGLTGTELTIRFSSANGERVRGLLLLPPASAGKGPYPCLLLLHGLGGSKSDARGLAPMIAKGYAVCALDAAYHGDRKQQGKQFFSTDVALTRQAFIQTIIDYRRAIDFLATRPEIDAKRIGLVGLSLGAMMGGVLTPVEPRIRTAVLVVGGGDWRTLLSTSQHSAALAVRERLRADPAALDPLDSVDPLHYVEHISPRPLLMQNGRQDTVMPAACVQALWDRAKEPKCIDWYDSGHVPPIFRVLQKINDWCAKYLQ